MSKPDPKANQEATHQVATVEIPPPDNPSGAKTPLPPEFGGRKGPEATRYGDWENDGKCVDF
jgi:hypothetical protein